MSITKCEWPERQTNSNEAQITLGFTSHTVSPQFNELCYLLLE